VTAGRLRQGNQKANQRHLTDCALWGALLTPYINPSMFSARLQRLRSQFDGLAVDFAQNGRVDRGRLTDKSAWQRARITEISSCPHRALLALPAPCPNIATARCSERCVYTV
jgi:hypothetical protein